MDVFKKRGTSSSLAAPTIYVLTGHIVYTLGITTHQLGGPMPWKETCVMDERTKFIGRLLAGEKMAPLCREFGITRRTGYKIWERYQQDGNTGLYNRSRAPQRHPNQTPFEVEKLIVRLKTDKPSWGARLFG